MSLDRSNSVAGINSRPPGVVRRNVKRTRSVSSRTWDAVVVATTLRSRWSLITCSTTCACAGVATTSALCDSVRRNSSAIGECGAKPTSAMREKGSWVAPRS